MLSGLSLDAFIGDPVFRRKVAENIGQMEKEEKRVISVDTVPVSASIEPSHVAHKIGMLDEQFREFRDHFKHDKGFILPEEHEAVFGSALGQNIVDLFEAVLTDKFEGTANRNARKPIMHVPTISAFYNCMRDALPGDEILVISPTNKDVKRLTDVKAKHFATKSLRFSFVVDARAKHKDYSTIYSINYLTDVDAFLHDQDSVGKFAAIVVPYTMGYLFDEGGRNRYEVARLLRMKLRPFGTMTMLYFDIDALKQISSEDKYVADPEITVYTESPLGAEGCCLTSVGNEIFRDYRYTPESLYKFGDPADILELYSARDALKERFHPPPELREAAVDRRLEPIRFVYWQRVEASEEPHSPEPYQGWPDLVETDICFSSHPMFYNVHANRGRAYGTGDLFFLNPDRIYVAPKADGYEAVLAFDEHGVGWLKLRGRDKLYRLADARGPPSLVVQVEMIGSCGPNWVDFKYPVLTDVISGTPKSLGYWSRMEEAKYMLRSYGILVCSPQLVKLTSALCMPEAPDYPWDGYVLNYDAARCGVFSDGFGAARYIKPEYTYDEMCDDGLVREFYMDGRPCVKFGKHHIRHDKTTSTSEEHKQELKEAWTVSQFLVRAQIFLTVPSSLMSKINDEAFEFDMWELLFLWFPNHPMDFEREVGARRGTYGLNQISEAMTKGLNKFLHAKRVGGEASKLAPPVFAEPVRMFFDEVEFASIAGKRKRDDDAEKEPSDVESG